MNPMSGYLGQENRLSKLLSEKKNSDVIVLRHLCEILFIEAKKVFNKHHLDQEKPPLHLLSTHNLHMRLQN